MTYIEKDARYRAVVAVWNHAHSIRGGRPRDFGYMMRELEKACLRTISYDRIRDFPLFIRRIEGGGLE